MTISVNGGTFNEGWFGTDRDSQQAANICNPGNEGLTVAATFDWDNDPVGVRNRRPGPDDQRLRHGRRHAASPPRADRLSVSNDCNANGRGAAPFRLGG